MRIGIVGLGIGGATAAAALVKRGCQVTVFEQAAEIREVGAGVATWPSTIRSYLRMGLGPTFAAIGCLSPGSLIHNASGVLMQNLIGQASDSTPGYTFHRAELLQTIASLVPREYIRLGKRCAAAREFDGGVELSFEDGSVETFDVVIAADGVRSQLRGAVLPAEPPRFANLAAYRGLIRARPEIPLTQNNLWTDGVKYFVAFPVSGGRLINFVGVTPTDGLPDASWFQEGRKADLAAEFADWDPRLQSIIDSVTETFRWGLYFRDPAPKMATARIALLGDAAHPMLIHAGQGVGQAMEDGFAIGVLLAGATASDAPRRLALYEQLRLPRTTAVQQQSRRNAQFLHASVPLDEGETRPTQIGEMDWINNYDVEAEAERLLDLQAHTSKPAGGTPSA